MDKRTERAYKRTCFQGRGAVARWVDRVFFALLGGACLYIACRNFVLSCLLLVGLLAFSLLWERKRWARFRQDLWQRTVRDLRREAWLKGEAARLRQGGGVILYPLPDGEALVGLCLRYGQGTAFHVFGDPKQELIHRAKALGCTLAFHPWREGPEPSQAQVLERLKQNAPKRERTIWRALWQLPGNRYLLTGGVLLLLSLFLRRALYWRLLGSLCMMLGAVRRLLHVEKT